MGVLRDAYSAVTLQASEAQTATGNGSEVRLPHHQTAVVFTCDLTVAATDAGDTLDVFVQTKLDGANWTDVVHFTQMLGNGGAKRFYAKVNATANEGQFENASALAAGSERDLIGDSWRVRWAIVDSGDADQSFTFSVTGLAM